jgi:hypothetical protein
MADYQSYSTYVAPEESQDAPYRNPVARDTGEVTSVVVRNGEIASETTHNNHFVKASELETGEQALRKPQGPPLRPSPQIPLSNWEAQRPK